MKDTEESLLEETAVIVQKMCKDYGATFIIDDHVYLTQKLKADGVHLGKNDMPVAEARKILGDSYIIGSTVNSFQDILSVIETSTPDYFGCGPFRYTSTKKNLAPILGLEGYRNIISQMKIYGIDIPLVAIGGISKEDIPELMQSGIKGIALSGSILKAVHPQDEMKEIVNIISMNC
jgi:thiamine-phosphate pyrophosphorylase